jgi:biopolymer transport protein ExbD/biopolymer transport protein TolR
MELADKGLRSDINVTPLVDVMLVLLIIFMVITPMLQRGKAVQLPSVSQPEKQPDNGRDMIVSVEFAGDKSHYSVYFGQEKVPEGELQTKIEDEMRKDSSKEVFIKGDARLSYGAVRKVMQICHEAGFTQVRLASEELKGAL